MRTSKPKAKLTRAEIAAALRRRAATEKRRELTDLVKLAYELGRRTKHQDPIPATRLLAELRNLRAAKQMSKTNRRAAAYLALLENTKPATITELREAFNTPSEAA